MTPENPWPVVELRQYTLRPGSRDTMIELFDREFVETQESCGMRIIGQFRDADDPDRFVWLRAFRDIRQRHTALTAFYVDGEAWRIHAPAARATMVDTDDAVLLRPLQSFPPRESRPAPGATELPGSRVSGTVYRLHHPAEDGFAEFFTRRVRPILTATGAEPIAVLVSDPAPNDFSRLPLRTGEHLLAWFATFGDTAALEEHRRRLAAHAEWTGSVRPELERWLAAGTRALRLAPTARSMLR